MNTIGPMAIALIKIGKMRIIIYKCENCAIYLAANYVHVLLLVYNRYKYDDQQNDRDSTVRITSGVGRSEAKLAVLSDIARS